MSLLFSAVTARTEDDEVELLVPGIPTEMDDFDGWVLFESFLHGIDSEQEVRVHVESYLYGEGESVRATPEEIAYLTIRQSRDADFLSGHCDAIADSDFFFTWIPEEQGMEMM